LCQKPTSIGSHVVYLVTRPFHIFPSKFNPINCLNCGVNHLIRKLRTRVSSRYPGARNKLLYHCNGHAALPREGIQKRHLHGNGSKGISRCCYRFLLVHSQPPSLSEEADDSAILVALDAFPRPEGHRFACCCAQRQDADESRQYPYHDRVIDGCRRELRRMGSHPYALAMTRRIFAVITDRKLPGSRTYDKINQILSMVY
jgi:hypothetical protein